MKLYRQKKWKAYCSQQIKLHGNRCCHCLRLGSEVVLQVHHRDYVTGRMPWEYPFEECEVLCKGCHAKEHSIIMPSKDWELIGQDDLGGLDGECDKCEKQLRYAHMISHEKWGVMIVRKICCDHLTESTIGSELHKDFLNYLTRRKKFVDPKNWAILEGERISGMRNEISIEISKNSDGKFLLCLNEKIGKKTHDSVLDAQIWLFDYIESGQTAEYFAQRKEKLRVSSYAGR